MPPAANRGSAPPRSPFTLRGRHRVSPTASIRHYSTTRQPQTQSAIRNPQSARRLAADVARFGDDWTIIGLRQGPILLDLWPIKGADTVKVAEKIEELAYAEYPAAIAVDVIGIGAGVVDNLVNRGVEGLEPVNVSHAAFDPERFANRRAELYWGLRERLHQGDISLTDDKELVEELAAIRYKINPRGQIQIESKEDMKRRLRRSPDRADMLAILFDSSSDALALLPERRRGPTERELLVAEMSRW